MDNKNAGVEVSHSFSNFSLLSGIRNINMLVLYQMNMRKQLAIFYFSFFITMAIPSFSFCLLREKVAEGRNILVKLQLKLESLPLIFRQPIYIRVEGSAAGIAGAAAGARAVVSTFDCLRAATTNEERRGERAQ